MGIFRSSKGKANVYVDSGVLLSRELIRSLALPGWRVGPPLLPDYTLEEVSAIERNLSDFQETANDVIGVGAKFHPEATDSIRRKCAAEALYELAEGQWRFTPHDELPKNWKSIVSTYLKAWASDLNPLALLGMAKLLARAGRKDEARKSLQVPRLFPAYADRFFGRSSDASQLASEIVGQAEQALRDL